MAKSPDAFRTISEVADWLGVQAHVLRFWESKFTQVKPVKRAGGRRYYRPADMLLLGGIKKLLHDDGVTIKGVQKMMREQGVAHISSLSQSLEEAAVELSQDIQGKVIQFKQDRPESDVPDQIDMELEPVQSVETTGEAPAETPVQSASVDETPVEAIQAEHPEYPLSDTSPGVHPEFSHREPVSDSAPQIEDSQDAAAANEEIDLPAASTLLRPTKIDVAEVPADDQIPYAPGLAVKLAAIRALTPEQAREIVPIAAELRNWLARHPHSGMG
ncbi:MerR family transcriptional regulator [Primorskyibacter sp. S87]|uniref:MerR family transcriptional regulator n=1 Tax=Primorskyibacter sp. S87 TaxID=3415126 RepID=UPI003C7A8084